MISTYAETYVDEAYPITKANIEVHPPGVSGGFVALKLGDLTLCFPSPCTQLSNLSAVLQEAKDQWDRSKDGIL